METNYIAKWTQSRPGIWTRVSVEEKPSPKRPARKISSLTAKQLQPVKTLQPGKTRIQQRPLAVRVINVVEPGRLPLCHQFPMLTIHPRAYFPDEVAGYTGQGVVMSRIVSGFNMLGIAPDPATWSRN